MTPRTHDTVARAETRQSLCQSSVNIVAQRSIALHTCIHVEQIKLCRVPSDSNDVNGTSMPNSWISTVSATTQAGCSVQICYLLDKHWLYMQPVAAQTTSSRYLFPTQHACILLLQVIVAFTITCAMLFSMFYNCGADPTCHQLPAMQQYCINASP